LKGVSAAMLREATGVRNIASTGDKKLDHDGDELIALMEATEG
jgi:hypothetical protein